MCWAAGLFPGLEKLIKGCFPSYTHAHWPLHRRDGTGPLTHWQSAPESVQEGTWRGKPEICSAKSVSPLDRAGEYSSFFVILPWVLEVLLVWTVNCARSGRLKDQEEQQLRSRTSCSLCWSQMQQGNLPERNKVWQYTVFRSDTQ